MPAVTVPPNPKGLPIATTHSPTLDSLLLPKLTKGKLSLDSIFNRAKSILGSNPTTSAS